MTQSSSSLMTRKSSPDLLPGLRNQKRDPSLYGASLIRIALVESDPLRLMAFRALFESDSALELVSASLPDIDGLQSIDEVLLSNCSAENLFDLIAGLKAARPDLPIVVTGSGDQETILKAIVAGAKGYVDESASPAEFVQAVRVVSQGGQADAEGRRAKSYRAPGLRP